MLYFKEFLELHLFYKQLGSGPCFQSCLHFQDFQGSELLNGCLVFWPNKQILSLFQWFSAFLIDKTYTVSKYISSFYEIRSLALCILTLSWRRSVSYINQSIDLIPNRQSRNASHIFGYCRWFNPKSYLTIYVRRASCL